MSLKEHRLLEMEDRFYFFRNYGEEFQIFLGSEFVCFDRIEIDLNKLNNIKKYHGHESEKLEKDYTCVYIFSILNIKWKTRLRKYKFI